MENFHLSTYTVIFFSFGTLISLAEARMFIAGAAVGNSSSKREQESSRLFSPS